MAERVSIDDRLGHIVEWSRRIAAYIDGMTIEGFLTDTKTQDAVIRCLEVIGEASAGILKIDPDFERNHPGLELSAAYRARNRTAYGYGSIDLASVWQSAFVSSPAIASHAQRVLDERRNAQH